MLVDSHAHLDDPRLASDLPEVIERARKAGLVGIITVGADVASSRAAVDLAHRFPMVWAAVGIHPHEAKTFSADALRELFRLAADSKVVAIGEIGLDYHYNYSPPSVQRVAFREQLLLANEVNLPVIIHDREAHSEVEAVLEEIPPKRRGVFHCFSGDATMASRLLGKGYYLSFAGPVTFERAEEHYRRILQVVPLGKFLVETDSPYLSPVPFRGQRNEPARVTLVAARIATLLGTDLQEVVEATAKATANLFGLALIGAAGNREQAANTIMKESTTDG